jgi:outer membrane autotransporter protein
VSEDDEGYETIVEKINRNRWYLGFMAGFQNIGKIETEHKNSNKNGTGNGSSKSVGIYGSYIAKNGLFVDLTLRNFWLDFDMKTYSSSNEQISFKPQTTQTALSIETGKEFLFGKNVVFEPKAELLFAYNPEVTVTASNSNKINYSSNILCSGKLGFMLGFLNNNAKHKNWLPYLEASYNYDFNNKTDVTYSDTTETIDFSDGYFDLGLGLNTYFGKGVSAYGLISYEKGNNQNNFAYNIGVRYGF